MGLTTAAYALLHSNKADNNKVEAFINTVLHCDILIINGHSCPVFSFPVTMSLTDVANLKKLMLVSVGNLVLMCMVCSDHDSDSVLLCVS